MWLAVNAIKQDNIKELQQLVFRATLSLPSTRVRLERIVPNVIQLAGGHQRLLLGHIQPKVVKICSNIMARPAKHAIL